VDRKRLERLAARSEEQKLNTAELEEYRRLSERAERLNAVRVRALAELARLRKQPIQQVMQDIGWQEPSHGS
jgi:hypothetical protein